MWWLWLFLYPIPAAFTAPEHALRSIAGCPLFAVLSGLGVTGVIDICKGIGQRRVFVVCSGLIVAGSLGGYARHYFLKYPGYSAPSWQYGMKEAITFSEQSSSECSIISADPYFYPSYIFVLFFTQYSPKAYQELPMQSRMDLWRYTKQPVGKFYNFNLRDVDLRRGECLYITLPGDTARVAEKGYRWRAVRTIFSPDGTDLIKIISVMGRGDRAVER